MGAPYDSLLVIAMCKAGDDTLRFKQLYFCMYASLGVLAPYVPVFFERLQMSKSQIGILLMIPSISSFVFAPPWSMLCDRLDIRSEVMFFALVVSQILTVSMYFFDAFWSMSLIVVFGSIVKAPLSSLLDSLVIDSLEDKSSYGSLRLWGAVSFALTSFLGGAVIAAFGEPFIYVFGLHGFFGALSGCIILSMTLNSRREKILAAAVRQKSLTDSEVHDASNDDCVAKNGCDTPQGTIANSSTVGSEEHSVVRSVYRVMTLDPSVGIFLVVVFCSGLGSGVIDSFLFLRLRQLGGSGLVMGISRAITCVAEVPCFMAAGFLQKRLGTWRLLAITQLAFFIRFTYYSFLTVPWAVLPCEVLHGFTFAIMWTTACTYADEIAPKHVHSTVQVNSHNTLKISFLPSDSSLMHP